MFGELVVSASCPACHHLLDGVTPYCPSCAQNRDSFRRDTSIDRELRVAVGQFYEALRESRPEEAWLSVWNKWTICRSCDGFLARTRLGGRRLQSWEILDIDYAAVPPSHRSDPLFDRVDRIAVVRLKARLSGRQREFSETWILTEGRWMVAWMGKLYERPAYRV